MLDCSAGAAVVLWADAPAPSDLEVAGSLPRRGDELIGVLYLVVIGGIRGGGLMPIYCPKFRVVDA